MSLRRSHGLLSGSCEPNEENMRNFMISFFCYLCALISFSLLCQNHAKKFDCRVRNFSVPTEQALSHKSQTLFGVIIFYIMYFLYIFTNYHRSCHNSSLYSGWNQFSASFQFIESRKIVHVKISGAQFNGFLTFRLKRKIL